MTDYIEQHKETTRFYICTPSLPGLAVRYNVDRKVGELLDHLCAFHAFFRGEAISPAEQRSLYPVFALRTAESLEHPVLSAISQLPRNDARTNSFIYNVGKLKKSIVDKLSPSIRLVGHLMDIETRIKDILHLPRPSQAVPPHACIIIGIPFSRVKVSESPIPINLV